MDRAPASTPLDGDASTLAKSAIQDALARATQPLQRALSTLLALQGVSSSSPTELARTLKIEQTLAWRIWRLAYAPSGEEAAQFVIGSTALENFLSAGAKRGADAALVEDVRESHRQYRAFVDRFAGDDATLRMMLSPLSDERPGAALAESQVLFDAHRLRVGVQAGSQARCVIFYPSGTSENHTATIIDTFSDLWWLRHNSRAVMGVRHLIQTKPEDRGNAIAFLPTPLDPTLEREMRETGREPEVALIKDFCSGDSTLISPSVVGGAAVFSMYPKAVGRDRAATVCIGQTVHATFPPLSKDPRTGFSKYSLVPSEQLVLEAYVSTELVEKGYVLHPAVTDALFWPNMAALWAPRIPFAALGGTFQAIEPSRSVDNPTKMARYRELVEWSFGRVGQNREDFYCYRLKVPMPPLGMMFSLEAGALER